MIEGLAAGFILSLVLFPGTVWLVKVCVAGTARQALAVALGFALSQFFWLLVAIPGLLMMMMHLSPLRPAIHLFASFVLFYMAFKTIRGGRVEALDDTDELPSIKNLFRDTFNRALAIPMRLPLAMATLLATGVYVNNPNDWGTAPDIVFGGLLGVTWWWGQIFLLAVLFSNRVSQSVTLKSLNKIRPFGSVLLAIMGIISLLLIE